MKDYTTITINNNGQPFPDTRAKDASGPLATDGTEYIKEVVDDIWVEKQADLDFYDYPPTGVEDLKGVDPVTGLPKSQRLAARYMNYATPGTIVNWPSAEDPFDIWVTHGIDIRLLLLNGQGIDRTEDEYKMLDSIVYIGDPDNAAADSFYHADDAGGTIRNIAGDYLILPDLRGYSFRGLDEGRGVDPDTSRIVGSNQDDAFQNITGSFFLRQKSAPIPKEIVSTTGLPPLFSVNPSTFPAVATNEIQSTGAGGAKDLNQVDFDASGDPSTRTDVETRNKNIATRYAIHY